MIAFARALRFAGLRCEKRHDSTYGVFRLKRLLLVACSTCAVTACSINPAKVVEVPVRQSCVANIAPKPARLTPCPKDVTPSQCVKRAALDIERLQSAVDQLTLDLEACK